MVEKHYVYSARTTKEGLALLKQAKGDMGWDRFVNEAVAAHYGLDISVIQLPPSKFVLEREEKKGETNGKKSSKKTTQPSTNA